LKPIIEPLNLPQDKLNELKAVFANPDLPELHKLVVLRQTSGACHRCGLIPSHIVKYPMSGITRIEKYCDECLKIMVTNKKTKVKIDR
jgi:hypothetical protein